MTLHGRGARSALLLPVGSVATLLCCMYCCPQHSLQNKHLSKHFYEA